MTHTPTPAHQPGMTGGSMSAERDCHGYAMGSSCSCVTGHDCQLAPEATDPTPGEVGLSEAERESVCACPGFGSPMPEDSHVYGCTLLLRNVERILAARTADLRAERDAEVEGATRAVMVAESAQRMAEAEVAVLRATVDSALDVVDLSCHHCGRMPETGDGDHNCLCPLSHSECLTHTTDPVVSLTALRAALTAHRHEEA